MKWKVTTAPSVEPLTLAEVKENLRISWSDEDDVLEAAIRDCRDWCEQYLDMAIPPQTITLKLDKFPSVKYIELPRTNLIEVDSVSYIDEDGATQTVATTVYGVDTYSTPGRIFLKADQDWPDDEIDQENAVTIVYQAGFQTDEAGVNAYPGSILRAMRLLSGHWNENREGSIVGASVVDLPMGVSSALDKHRIYGV